MLDALKLMRIPFSIFLMPVFWFSLSNLESPNVLKGLHIFLMLHIFVYPASNGYNSYFDRDEESIGGLEKPPKVNAWLFPLVVTFDFIALIYAYWIRSELLIWMLIYLLISKAYSYDKIRLKKFPILSTAVVTLFQGAFIFMAVQFGMGNKFEEIMSPDHLLPAFCSSLFLLGSYPLTQIYQHREDAKRGDQTLSLKLGIHGTFRFSQICFALGTMVLLFHYFEDEAWLKASVFLICGLPILLYFQYWWKRCSENEKQADFQHAMRMNVISSLCLSAAFIIMLWLK